MEHIVDRMAEVTKDREREGDDTTDKLQAMTTETFARKAPFILDTDPDLDKYNREFDNWMGCLTVANKKPRHIDKLHRYGNGFPEGSTRRKVFDNAHRKAQRDKRPACAQ